MTESEENFDSALEKALQCLSYFEMSRELRTEQTKAIRTVVSRGGLLAVLPNGFRKILIFQVQVRVKEILTVKTSVVIVVCPLKSIVQDRIAEASSLRLTAVSLADNRLEDIKNAKYQLVFASAEEVLSKSFLSSLM